ncbi:MAG: hypothetical protein IJV98_06920 [Clostridia bacterium]|nr:hypothetical protein [Clostridia bacterium]
MLIKGYKKELIIVKSLGSDYIDEAYLILKPDLPSGIAKEDIVKEANRIVHEYDTGQRKKRRTFSPVSFSIGALLSGALTAFLCLIL